MVIKKDLKTEKVYNSLLATTFLFAFLPGMGFVFENQFISYFLVFSSIFIFSIIIVLNFQILNFFQNYVSIALIFILMMIYLNSFISINFYLFEINDFYFNQLKGLIKLTIGILIALCIYHSKKSFENYIEVSIYIVILFTLLFGIFEYSFKFLDLKYSFFKIFMNFINVDGKIYHMHLVMTGREHSYSALILTSLSSFVFLKIFEKKNIILNIVILLFFTFFLIHNFSKLGYFLYFTTLILIFFIKFKNFNYKHLILISLCVIPFLLIYNNLIHEIVFVQYKKIINLDLHSAYLKYIGAKISILSFMDYPLGIGINNFKNVLFNNEFYIFETFKKYNELREGYTSSYLNMDSGFFYFGFLLEVGLIAFIIFFFLLFGSFLKILRYHLIKDLNINIFTTWALINVYISFVSLLSFHNYGIWFIFLSLGLSLRQCKFLSDWN